MAHFHIKTKKGRPYLYVREIARVGGKPTVVSQIYIGSPERVAGLVSGSGESAIKLKVEEFGALWLAEQISRDVNLVGIVDSEIPKDAREKAPAAQTQAISLSPVDMASLIQGEYFEGSWTKWVTIPSKKLGQYRKISLPLCKGLHSK